MDYIPRIVSVGALVGDTARAFMLSALMDDRARTATELALEGRITPQTASSHLAKLTGAGLLAVEQRGRYRYFRLAGPQVAYALEALMVLGESGAVPNRRRYRGPICTARTCYDHLAGELGVKMLEALKSREHVDVKDEQVRLTEAGEKFFHDLGIDLAAVRRRRRAFARICSDWSEHSHHLAGAMGAALHECLLRLDWIRQRKNSRVVSLTHKGRLGFRRTFAIEISE